MNKIIFLSALCGVMFIVAVAGVFWLNSDKASDFRLSIREAILKELSEGNPIKAGTKVDAIYVLGGGERSLKHKYIAAAELYKNRVSQKILIFSRPGYTRFSKEFGRNLTNDEWSLERLLKLGIPCESIEFVRVEEGFFGTLSEAKHISEIVYQRKQTSLVAISDLYHTKRVHISFKRFLLSDNFSFFTYNSSNNQMLSETIVELIKLVIYKYILL